MNLFGFGSEPLVDIKLASSPSGVRQVKIDDVPQKLNLYKDDNDISGKVSIKLDKRKKLDHYGIRVLLVGSIDIKSEKVLSSTFMTNGLDLEPAGTLYEDKTYSFNFPNFQKQYESYYGKNIVLRYYIRLVIVKKFSKDFEFDKDIFVLSKVNNSAENNKINIEVGIDDCLNININFPKNSYSLKDVIKGEIVFSSVKLMVKKMELCILRKEILGSGSQANTISEELNNFEIMEGCPVSEEVIPVRFYLGSISNLTPTMEGVNNKFSIKYFINICIYDDQNRKFFKPSEIVLYRDDN